MNTLPSVLLYGRDSNLLEIRRLVLQQAQIQAWTATDFEQAEKLTAIQPSGVLVLCHSLSPEECGQALAMVRSRKPGRRTLVLSLGRPINGLGQDDELLSAYDGPNALVATIERLLKGINQCRTSAAKSDASRVMES